MAYQVYILRCGDGTLYTGATNNLERRLGSQQAGKGAKYTRSRRPVCLVYQEEAPDWCSALRREAAIKSMDRERKLRLIAGGGAPTPDRMSGGREEPGDSHKT